MKKESKSTETQNMKNFEKTKINKLNVFFLKNVSRGLIFASLLFIITVAILLFTIMKTNIDPSVKITIISMIVTFVLTSSKMILDRTIEIVTYTVRLLGEEQRGLNKKIGIDIEPVEFEDLSNEYVADEKTKSNTI